MCGWRLILPVAQGPAGSRAAPAAPLTLTPAAAAGRVREAQVTSCTSPPAPPV